MNKNAKDVQFIFLPGIPGRKKDFGFITDLRSKNLTVIEYRHPGLYEEAGKFSVSNTIKKIKSLLTEMEKAKKPYVVIAYSFSSLIIQKMTIDKYKYLRGIVMFSPILGLGSDWISEDFDDTLKQLIAEGNCRPATNLDKEISELKKQKYDFDQLKKITACGLPICFFFSKNDTVINIKRLEESTQVFKDFFGQGSLFVIGESKGDHRIDTYYGESIRNLLLSFVAGEQVRNIVGDESYIFVWGSSQITNFFKDRYSDIDLYVLSNNYLKYFEELSILQSSFKVRFEVKLDLSINKIKDLFSEKISRFNRGPLLAHSLNNLYFNLGKRKIMIDVDFADVKQDCYKASLSIYRECEKQISRINGTEDQIRWFSKLFTVSIFYLLHVRGNKNVDMNNLERWLDKIKDKKKICLLRFAAKILAGGQKEMKKSDWLDLLEEMKKILVEEEKILDISYKTYPKKEGGKFEVINTPGKSKVVVSKYTKKVFKTYFLDSEEDARDKNRVIQHAKQLKFMGEHGINVPTNIKLIENESAIIMDYQDGVPLDKLIENENPLLKDIFNDLGDFLFKLHKILLMAPLADGFLVDDTELNYHCARNFRTLSLPNLMTLENSSIKNTLKKLALMADKAIEKNPQILEDRDVIYGDFKPENMIWDLDQKTIFLLDPMISRGKVSCDIGKFLSRTLLKNDKIASKELFSFIKRIKTNYGEKVLNESLIMAALDMLNTFSRIISSNKHDLNISSHGFLLNKLIPGLLEGKFWTS